MIINKISKCQFLSMMSIIADTPNNSSKRMTFQRKECIFSEGSLADSFAVVLTGSVQVIDKMGSEQFVVGQFSQGSIIGEMGMFTAQHRTSSVIAFAEVEALIITYEDFEKISARDPAFLFYIAKKMAERLSVTTKHAGQLATRSTKERIQFLIEELALSDDSFKVEGRKGVFVKISRKSISQRVGCSRELAGKILKELESEGKITMKGMKLNILLPK